MEEKRGDCLMDVRQLMDFCSFKESRVRALVFNKRIPFIKVGRLIRFRRGEIEAWLDKQHQAVLR